MLIVTLIVLIAMLLAGLSLLRSVGTSNQVAGNLAFQEAAIQAAEAGVETAIAWLENGPALRLHQNAADGSAGLVAYFAVRQDPGADVQQSWPQFWDVLDPPVSRHSRPPLAVAGNEIRFVIHRLCPQTGDPTAIAGCATSPTGTGSDSGSRGAGVVGLLAPSPVYYRITVRVDGPRNTLRFVQAVVSL